VHLLGDVGRAEVHQHLRARHHGGLHALLDQTGDAAREGGAGEGDVDETVGLREGKGKLACALSGKILTGKLTADVVLLTMGFTGMAQMMRSATSFGDTGPDTKKENKDISWEKQ